jgi:hypothetical protein
MKKAKSNQRSTTPDKRSAITKTNKSKEYRPNAGLGKRKPTNE